MTQKAVRAIVSGRVQGVGFRYWTKREAYFLGVHGYVKNLEDGSVEAFLEGDEDAVSAMLEALHRGPDLSNVAEVKTQEHEFHNEYETFLIL